MNQRARVATEDKDEDRPTVSQIRRMMMLEANRQEYGTPVGLMRLAGDITEQQYAVCKWFDELYDAYLPAIDRKRGIRTSTGERVDAGHAPDPFSEAGEKIVELDARIVRDFDSAKLVAISVGQEDFQRFWATVIEGEAVFGAVRAVSRVADALDKYRRLGSKHRKYRR